MPLDADTPGDVGIGQQAPVGRALAISGQDLRRQGLLALEVIVEGALGDRRGLGDVLHAGGMEATLGEQLHARVVNEMTNAATGQGSRLLLAILPFPRRIRASRPAGPP